MHCVAAVYMRRAIYLQNQPSRRPAFSGSESGTLKLNDTGLSLRDASQAWAASALLPYLNLDCPALQTDEENNKRTARF